jgi:predicted dehydrogenase
MGTSHARVLARLAEHCRLVGIYDVDPERARGLAARHDVPAVESFDALLDRCDAVVIAASTAVHVPQVLACVDAGRHVLVEKPAAPTLEATLALREAVRAHAAPPVVQVGHIEHFNPSVAALRHVLAGGVPRAVSARRLGPPVWRGDALDVIADLMLHDIHVVTELAAGALEGAAATAVGTGGEPTHYAHAMLRFDDGMMADLTASRITQARVRLLEVTMGDSHITADYARRTVAVARWDERTRETVVEYPLVSADEPLERELLAFLHAVRAGAEPEVGLDAAVRCMRVVDAIGRHTVVHAPEAHDPELAVSRSG